MHNQLHIVPACESTYVLHGPVRFNNLVGGLHQVECHQTIKQFKHAAIVDWAGGEPTVCPRRPKGYPKSAQKLPKVCPRCASSVPKVCPECALSVH